MFYSMLLQMINKNAIIGSKNSILYCVLKLNPFKSIQVFFLYVCLEKS